MPLAMSLESSSTRWLLPPLNVYAGPLINKAEATSKLLPPLFTFRKAAVKSMVANPHRREKKEKKERGYFESRAVTYLVLAAAKHYKTL